MARHGRLALLVLLFAATANILWTSSAAAAQRPGENLESFRARLTAYMEDLSRLQPSGVSPDVIASVARLDYQQLEMLQKAFPADERFWSTPGKVGAVLAENGMTLPAASPATGQSVTASGQSFIASPSRATTLSGPSVSTFQFSGPSSITEGGTFTFSYAASASAGLTRFELWRTIDNNNSPNGNAWTSVASFSLSGNSASSTVTYSPATFGTFWFGVHVLDSNGVIGYEPSPIKGVVNVDPNKKCPANFDYETLWLTRDMENVAEIAKELIPDDTVSALPHGILAAAWGVAKTMRFAVEQIYLRHADCENDRVASKIDATVSSRAEKTTVDSMNSKVDSIKTTVDGFNLSRLDTNVGSRADQTTVLSIKTKVDGMNLGNLDTTVSSRADQATVGAIQTRVNGLDTSKLDAQVSTRADQTTANDIKTKVNTLDTSNLDAKITSRADQPTVDAIQTTVGDVQTKVTGNLDAKITTRADQTTVNGIQTTVGGIQTTVGGIQTRVNSLDTSKLDATVASRADQLTANEIRDKVNALNTTRLDVPVSTRCEQATLTTFTAGSFLTFANNTTGTLAAILGKVNSLDAGKVDVSVSTRATQTSVDEIFNTVKSQEQLHVEAVEIVRDQRYLVQVTKRGTPAAGATVAQLTSLTLDKNGAFVSTALTPTVREVAPGVLDIGVTIPSSIKVEAFAITVNQGQGATALAGSGMWSGKGQNAQ